MTSRETLEAIRSNDPDGWQHVEPTEKDYRAFRNWVLATYGAEAWRDYHGIWDE